MSQPIMVLVILQREYDFSDSFRLIFLLYSLIWLGLNPYLASSYRFLVGLNQSVLVELCKDPIPLGVAVLDFTSDDWIEDALPFLLILLIVRGTGKQGHIIDNVMCS